MSPSDAREAVRVAKVRRRMTCRLTWDENGGPCGSWFVFAPDERTGVFVVAGFVRESPAGGWSWAHIGASDGWQPATTQLAAVDAVLA